MNLPNLVMVVWILLKPFTKEEPCYLYLISGTNEITINCCWATTSRYEWCSWHNTENGKKTRFQKEMNTVLSEEAMQLHIVKQFIIIYTVMDSEDCKPGRFM